jgi:hypothetical protein
VKVDALVRLPQQVGATFGTARGRRLLLVHDRAVGAIA